MLHRMVMIAEARIELGMGALNGDLGIILSCCMKSSVDQQMTGALVWDAGYFFEVLEGRAEALRAFHDRIAGDARIAGLQLLEFLPVTRRDFDTWAVGTPGPRQWDRALLAAARDGTATAADVRSLVSRVMTRGTLAESPPLVAA